MNRLSFLLLFFFISKLSFSQGEIAETDKIFYKNASSLAIVLNSTGFGINYRYGKRIDAFKRWIAESDISIIKDPKEVKIYNSNFDSQKRYVFGKLNEAIALRFGIGKQHEIYSKFDKGSIAIQYFYTAGVSFAFMKPIYYEMVDSTYINPALNTITYYYGTHKFNTSLHKSNDVVGKAPFKMGIDELAIVPGVYAKAGLSFEYSKTDTIIRALEAGFVVDIYTKKLPIMASSNNRQMSFSIFIAYRWGNIIDGKKRGTKKKNYFSRKKESDIGVGEGKGVIKEEDPNNEE